MACRILQQVSRSGSCTNPFLKELVRTTKLSTRNMVTTGKGEILASPAKLRFGISKVVAVSVPSILIGATLAKNGAAWLEENEIFIPDDDDDD